MAELGDKTKLCEQTHAEGSQSFKPIWLGARAGMILAISLAIGVGYFIGSRIPEAALKWLSASVFAVFGVITLITALQGL